MQSLKWRNTNSIDSIGTEDWSLFERNFPYSVDSVNKKGQPCKTIIYMYPINICSHHVVIRLDNVFSYSSAHHLAQYALGYKVHSPDKGRPSSD